MDKEQQIEEIKQVLIKTCKRCRPFEEDYMQSKYAESLYNAGYRKIPEDAVVLTKVEYESLRQSLTQTTVRECELADRARALLHECDILKIDLEKARKDTAKAILNVLYFNLQNSVKGHIAKSNVYYNVMDRIQEIAKNYGVEAEE